MRILISSHSVLEGDDSPVAFRQLSAPKKENRGDQRSQERSNLHFELRYFRGLAKAPNHFNLPPIRPLLMDALTRLTGPCVFPAGRIIWLDVDWGLGKGLPHPCNRKGDLNGPESEHDSARQVRTDRVNRL